jgi:predicted Zn-dependent peptidase
MPPVVAPFLLVTALASTPTAAPGLPVSSPSPSLSATAGGLPEIPCTRFTLENGLEVLVVEDHRTPLVAVDLWVHVGSGDEQPGRTGFAHLFEHMMFQGALHIGEDVHFDVLRKLGATQINGTTNSDRTNYFEVVPSHQLESALWLESDRLGFLLPLLTDKSLANQRDVVRNERRQRYDNVPYGRERFATSAALFPEGHPYRFLTIGRHEDIDGASVDDVRAFWTRWYTPSNATLALVGDVTVGQARTLVTRWFAGLRTAPRPPPTRLPAVSLAADVRVEVDDPFARLPRLRWAWHGPKVLDDDDLDLGVVADVLGAPGWGRLQKALVIDNPVAQSVTVSAAAQQHGGTFQIAVTLKPDADATAIARTVDAELTYLITHGPTAAELSRSILNTEASLWWGLEDVLSRAERLQFFGHYTGDVGYTGTYLERLRTRTVSSVAAAGQKWLRRPRALIVTRPMQPTSSSSSGPVPGSALNLSPSTNPTPEGTRAVQAPPAAPKASTSTSTSTATTPQSPSALVVGGGGR